LPRLDVNLPFSSTSSNATSSRFMKGFGIAALRSVRVRHYPATGRHASQGVICR
jgi:hypothetical protein